MPERYHHGNLREALLRAALELIENDGLAGLSLRAVARCAGVSHTAHYHHFADRAALIAALAEEGFLMLREAMAARMEAFGDPRLRFRQAGVAYVLFAVAHPAHFRVMFSAEVADKTEHPSLAAAAQSTRAVLIESIVACQEAGLLREEDGQVLSLTAWSLVHGLAMLMLDGHLGPGGRTPAAAEATAERVAGLLWAGLWRS